VRVSEQGGRRKLEIDLPSRESARPTCRPRPHWSREILGEEHWLWGAGGGAYLLGDNTRGYGVPLVRRSVSAPSNPGKWTVGTGLADLVSETHEPWRLIRELFEEIALVDSEGLLVLPDFGDDARLTDLAREAITRSVAGAGVEFRGVRLYPARIRPPRVPQVLEIRTPLGQSVLQDVRFHLDPASRMINLLWVVELPGFLPGSLLDLERSPSRQTTQYPLLPGDQELGIGVSELTTHAKYLIDSVKEEVF
jgi:hypothetical protein